MPSPAAGQTAHVVVDPAGAADSEPGAAAASPFEEELGVLRTAVANRRIDILQMLLGEACLMSGADLDVPDGEGFTLLHRTVLSGDADAAAILIGCGASASRRTGDETGGTALHLAAVQGSAPLMRIVVAAAAREGSLELASRRGHTALHGASWMDGNGEMTSVLVSGGASTEARNLMSGDTALHYAARAGNHGAIVALLDGGADTAAVDFSGASVVDMAQWHGHRRVLALLRKRSQQEGIAPTGRACERRPDQAPLVATGGVTAMFERALGAFPQYSPTVLSRDPWVVSLDDFVSETEAERFVAACGNLFSSAVNSEGGGSNVDARVRTSSQCAYTPRPGCAGGGGASSCHEDPLLEGVLERIAELTAAPRPNLSIVNLLRYADGERYATHHDQTHFVRPPLAEGARVYTVLMYLSTPEEGGQTHFPDLNITVEAKKGRALIWPSVTDADPDVAELFTFHEALPVMRGVKHVANVWVHQYDYQTPNVLRRCGMDFFPPGSLNPIATACSSQRERRPEGRCRGADGAEGQGGART
eukprot:7389886-Prymnesium_polylepis.1